MLNFDISLFARGYYDNILYGGFAAGLNRGGGIQVNSAGGRWATVRRMSGTSFIERDILPEDLDCEDGCTE